MAGERGALRLVHAAPEAQPRKLFCGHCGASPGEGKAAAPGSRVCDRCGLGLFLEASPDTAPTPADAFMVVDSTMSVRALSRRAERVLGVSEPEAAGRHLSDFLEPADTDAPAAQSFFALVLLAATGGAATSTVAVRPAGEFGVRMWARVSTCGPATAALLLVFNMD
jgi:PAS domain-containing protein